MEILFKRINKEAMIPCYKHIGDGAQDLKAVSCSYNAKYDRFEYGLGFATEFGPKYRARICAKSGNTKTDAYIPNTPGLIDSNYRGEWLVIYKLRTPITDIEHAMDYAPYQVGDLIGQVWFEEVIEPEWVEVSALSDSNRGADGGLIRDDKNFK